MGNKKEIILSSSSDDSLANKFSDFFMRTITEIRDTIHVDNSSTSGIVVIVADVVFKGEPLIQLEPSTQDEACDILKSPSIFVALVHYPHIH